MGPDMEKRITELVARIETLEQQVADLQRDRFMENRGRPLYLPLQPDPLSVPYRVGDAPFAWPIT